MSAPRKVHVRLSLFDLIFNQGPCRAFFSPVTYPGYLSVKDFAREFTMRAVRFHGRGDIRLDEVDEPICGRGQVKV